MALFSSIHSRREAFLSRYNCDNYAQILLASLIQNCVVKRLTAILSSSCDELVNEISGNRRIGRSARWSPKGNVSRCDSALKLAARIGTGSSERETAVPQSDQLCLLDRNAGIMYAPGDATFIHEISDYHSCKCRFQICAECDVRVF